MQDLLFRLEGGDILVCDGAMGTQLMERGLPPGEPPESMNLTRLQDIEEIARLYHAAGADIVETNTFGGSPLKLAMYGLEARTEEINWRAVEAARRAVGSDAYVAASVGPTGRTLKPYGDTEPDDVAEAFQRQIHALLDAGADAICVETMSDLTEAVLAVKAAKSLTDAVPVFASMTFDPTPRGFRTIMGVSVADAAAGLTAAGADVVGSNCGYGSEQMVAVARELREHATLPILIQPNAGVPEMECDRAVYRETPEFMAEKARELIEAGVAIVGGCCGTTPAHIRAIRRVVDDILAQRRPSKHVP